MNPKNGKYEKLMVEFERSGLKCLTCGEPGHRRRSGESERSDRTERSDGSGQPEQPPGRVPEILDCPLIVVQDELQIPHIIARRYRRMLVIAMPIHTNVILHDYDMTVCIVLRCRPRSSVTHLQVKGWLRVEAEE